MNGLARTSRTSSYLLALLLAACGGGGGGPTGDLLTGTLTIPALGSGGDFRESGPNDDAPN